MNAGDMAYWEFTVRVFGEQEGAMTDREHWEFEQAAAEYAAEMAYERHLEDRGWMDTFEEEDRMHRGLSY